MTLALHLLLDGYYTKKDDIEGLNFHCNKIIWPSLLILHK